MASAAILAGGRSRRLGGVDKSRLVVDGRTILDRQLDALSAVADDVMLVGAQADRADARCRLVPDDAPDLGPLGGLDTALRAMRDDVLLVVACDMPFVTSALFAHLLAQAKDVDAVVPRTARAYHPLCAVYTAACRAVVRRHLDARQLAVRTILEALRVRVVGPEELAGLGDPDHLLANVNTPAELRDLAAIAHNL